jgi:hypothetical protein
LCFGPAIRDALYMPSSFVIFKSIPLMAALGIANALGYAHDCTWKKPRAGAPFTIRSRW